MPDTNKGPFLQAFPKCFVIFIGVIEVLAVGVLIATELGNVAASFWYTNVFAGGWCGLLMLVQFFSLFVAGCCAPGPPAALRAVVITFIALVACAALIGFDSYFIAQPSTCILTSSCASNANSTTIFSYSFQTNFFSVFNALSPFKTYTQTQAKFLFQTIQLGVGCLCFVLCIIYIIIYYVTKSKASKQVSPSDQEPGYRAPQPDYRSQQGGGYRQPPPRAPQAGPGEVPWNANRRY